MHLDTWRDQKGTAYRAAFLATHVDGDLVAARAAYAHAVAARDSTALDAVASDFENLGAMHLPADAGAVPGHPAVRHRADVRQRVLG
jgi:hypothetical protein